MNDQEVAEIESEGTWDDQRLKWPKLSLGAADHATRTYKGDRKIEISYTSTNTARKRPMDFQAGKSNQ